MRGETITVSEAAKRLGSTVKWVYKLIEGNRLEFEQPGGAGGVYLISARSVDRFRPGPVGRPPAKRRKTNTSRSKEAERAEG